MPRQYPDDFKSRACRLVDEALDGSGLTEYKAIERVAGRLDVAAETVRRWRRREQIDSGTRPGVTNSGAEEIRRLKRENAELRRANEILKTASAFFAAEPGRPKLT